MLAFTISFSTFLLICVDWHLVLSCKDSPSCDVRCPLCARMGLCTHDPPGPHIPTITPCPPTLDALRQWGCLCVCVGGGVNQML